MLSESLRLIVVLGRVRRSGHAEPGTGRNRVRSRQCGPAPGRRMGMKANKLAQGMIGLQNSKRRSSGRLARYFVELPRQSSPVPRSSSRRIHKSCFCNELIRRTTRAYFPQLFFKEVHCEPLGQTPVHPSVDGRIPSGAVVRREQRLRGERPRSGSMTIGG